MKLFLVSTLSATVAGCNAEISPPDGAPFETMNKNHDNQDGDQNNHDDGEPGEGEEPNPYCFCDPLPRAFLNPTTPDIGRAAYVPGVHARLNNTPGKVLEQLFWARYGEGMWFSECTQHLDTEDETSLIFLTAVHHSNQTNGPHVSMYHPANHPAAQTWYSHEPVGNRSDDEIGQLANDNLESHYCDHQAPFLIVPAWGATL